MHWKTLMIVLGFTAVFVALTIMLAKTYNLSVRVYLRNSFGNLEEGNGKMFDVMIFYSPQDAEIVNGVLVPTLQNTYNYKCCAKEIPTNVQSGKT